MMKVPFVDLNAQYLSIQGEIDSAIHDIISNTAFIGGKPVNDFEAAFAALNYVESLAAGDYLELIWASDDANMQMITTPSLFGGPQIPSVILTIVPVGA